MPRGQTTPKPQFQLRIRAQMSNTLMIPLIEDRHTHIYGTAYQLRENNHTLVCLWLGT